MGVTFLELLLCDCNELKLKFKLATEWGAAINELDWHKVAAAEYKKIESTFFEGGEGSKSKNERGEYEYDKFELET